MRNLPISVAIRERKKEMAHCPVHGTKGMPHCHVNKTRPKEPERGYRDEGAKTQSGALSLAVSKKDNWNNTASQPPRCRCQLTQSLNCSSGPLSYSVIPCNSSLILRFSRRNSALSSSSLSPYLPFPRPSSSPINLSFCPANLLFSFSNASIFCSSVFPFASNSPILLFAASMIASRSLRASRLAALSASLGMAAARSRSRWISSQSPVVRG